MRYQTLLFGCSNVQRPCVCNSTRHQAVTLMITVTAFKATSSLSVIHVFLWQMRGDVVAAMTAVASYCESDTLINWQC